MSRAFWPLDNSPRGGAYECFFFHSAIDFSEAQHVELIGQPSRGAQPPTLNLIAFPSLPELGRFTLRGAAINDTKTLVLNYVEEHPGCSAKSVTDGVPGRREKVLIFLQHLVGSDHVIDKGCDGKHAYHRTALNYSPPLVANIPRESKKKKSGSNTSLWVQ